jgi:hypothetical protein
MISILKVLSLSLMLRQNKLIAETGVDEMTSGENKLTKHKTDE